MNPADRLRHIVAVLRQEGSAPSLDAAQRIETYLTDAANGLTLDMAFGLSPAPGQTPWYETERREARNASIRKLREECFGNLSISAAAREMVKDARRLQATAFRPDRMTAAPRDDKARLIADALSTGLPFPGERRLRDILGNEM